MGIEHVIHKELHSRVKGVINYMYINPEELPNVALNLEPYFISTICVATAKLESGLIDKLYLMIPSTRHTLKISQSYQMDAAYPYNRKKVLSLDVEKDFPLTVFMGAIIDGRLPHTIVATEVKKGFLK